MQFRSSTPTTSFAIHTEIIMNGANGINGHGVPPALWSEARNADGRVYYYNTITKATQWTKPEDLMTPAEVSFVWKYLMLMLLC